MGNSVLLVLRLFFSLVALQNSGCFMNRTGIVVSITSQPPVRGYKRKPNKHNLPAVRSATPPSQLLVPSYTKSVCRAGFPEAFHTCRTSACTMLQERGHHAGPHDKNSEMHTQSCGFLWFVLNMVVDWAHCKEAEPLSHHCTAKPLRNVGLHS